jgi:rubrerythrin
MSYSRDELRRELREMGAAGPDTERAMRRSLRAALAGDPVSRRRLLVTGGATLSLGALLAACGKSSPNEGAISRVGTVPPTTALPDAVVNDVTLLRTATSLEYSALFVYDAVQSAGLLSGDAAELAKRFAEDHQRHAELFAELTAELGGEEYRCANPRLQETFVEPAIRLIAGDAEAGIEPSPDPSTDVLTVAHALESLAGATYQSFVPLLVERDLRADAMRVGEQEARHAAVLAMVINPDQLIDTSDLPGGEPLPEGAPTTFAVPGAFGSLSPIPVTIGAPVEAGTQVTLNLETLSLNSFVYEYLGACPE